MVYTFLLSPISSWGGSGRLGINTLTKHVLDTQVSSIQSRHATTLTNLNVTPKRVNREGREREKESERERVRKSEREGGGGGGGTTDRGVGGSEPNQTVLILSRTGKSQSSLKLNFRR